jgi:hypothetical protein
MESLLVLAFIMAFIGFVTSSVTFFKMVSKKEAQRLP